MALSNLITRLEQEAKAEVDRLEQQTVTELRAIERAADDALATLTARRLEDAQQHRKATNERELSQARREAHGRELRALHAQVARILARARALVLETAETAAYIEALPAHLREALLFVEGVPVRVRCRSSSKVLVRESLDSHSHAQIEVDDSMGPGVVVVAADGTVVIDNTLAARLTRAEPRLTVALAKRIRDGAE